MNERVEAARRAFFLRLGVERPGRITQRTLEQALADLPLLMQLEAMEAEVILRNEVKGASHAKLLMLTLYQTGFPGSPVPDAAGPLGGNPDGFLALQTVALERAKAMRFVVVSAFGVRPPPPVVPSAAWTTEDRMAKRLLAGSAFLESRLAWMSHPPRLERRKSCPTRGGGWDPSARIGQEG